MYERRDLRRRVSLMSSRELTHQGTVSWGELGGAHPIWMCFPNWWPDSSSFGSLFSCFVVYINKLGNKATVAALLSHTLLLTLAVRAVARDRGGPSSGVN